MYSFLAQPAFFFPALPQQLTEPHWLVQAYRYVGGRWVTMAEYTRHYPDSNYVGDYFNQLCRRGRALVPAGSAVLRFAGFGQPVIVRMFQREGGQWVQRQECKK